MDRITIPKFDGKNFTIWKFQIKMLMEGNDLWTIVKGKEEKPAQDAAAWKKRDGRARCLITMSMETELVSQVMDCVTAAEMWSTLKTIYQSASATNAHLYLQQWYKYELPEGESISNHISTIKRMASQLRASEQPQTTDAILTKTVAGLPKKYASVIAAWKSVDESKRTLEELTARLVDHETLLSQ